ncbi:MAG: hypothetical protein IKA30_01710, partial [Alphaproteobacteria bacterium]|nr:hypothetical protein [Alphaproteobacteria bacterium]
HVFKGKNMKKVSASVLNIILPKDYKNPLEDQDIDKIVPTAELLRNYTEYLCKYAYCCSNEDVSTDALYKLLKRNTSVQGLDVVHPTLFDEGGKKNAINKNMVLEVAKIYSTHISKEANLLMENNEKFDHNMTKMFGEIVTKHDYKPKEVEALKDVLISNSDDKEYTTTIANNVGMAYINSRKMLHNMRSR